MTLLRGPLKIHVRRLLVLVAGFVLALGLTVGATNQHVDVSPQSANDTLVHDSLFAPAAAATNGGTTHAVSAGSTDEAHEKKSDAPELPSLVTFLVEYLGHDYEWLEVWVAPIYSGVTSLLLIWVVMAVYRKRQMIPGPLQNFVEMLVEGMYNFFYGILGDETRRYIPLVGTLFFYILINNLLGIVPLGHSPSTSIYQTFALASVVFVYVQYTGIRRLGVGNYVYHLAGSPKGVAMWVLMPLFLVLHVIGELAKPLSLGLRLFGNIMGEDVLVAAFVGLGVMITGFIGVPVGLPIHLPFIFLGMLMSTIQALVFSLLSTIYILLMLPHADGDHH